MKIKLIVEHFKKMREKVVMKIVRNATDLSECCLGKTKIVVRNNFYCTITFSIKASSMGLYCSLKFHNLCPISILIWCMPRV